MNKPALCSAVKGKLNNHGGFSYLEMLMVVFILSLCTGVITDTLSLGIRQLQKLTKQSQATILLDTLSAVVRNDLTYATDYNSSENSFISTAKDIKQLVTQYGTGEWDANKALENAKYPSLSEAIQATSSVMNWTTNAVPGQIIRRSVFPNNDGSFSLYYSALTSSQDYSGKSDGGITSKNSNSSLYATISIADEHSTHSDDKAYVDKFKVAITIYDNTANVLAQKQADRNTVTPIHCLYHS